MVSPIASSKSFAFFLLGIHG
ncbi:hypothetical protein BDFB_008165 [Asbolus verrucosus]|uniref:Uncharacterized protein n=1 Tax=Asbolus verrucosus TaxID=1661398 RepID=A0A482VQ04_ASBVE|nr:hypothetical protein BDFB_008165 [Asbolus verrucosus]